MWDAIGVNPVLANARRAEASWRYASINGSRHRRDLTVDKSTTDGFHQATYQEVEELRIERAQNEEAIRAPLARGPGIA
jgi:hypothetical protein